MADSNTILISILLASIRPQNLSQFFYNLVDSCDDKSCVEVWVKIDEGDEAMRECLELAQDVYPLTIRYLQTPKEDGYYTLHHGYQQLYEACNPNSYFIVVLNDEVRFATKGWDTILKKYVGMYPDDLFRIKVSQQKLRNYYSVYECGPCPDNYPITTRRWMELAEGIGDCWGPDVWHQMIDYHLGMASAPQADLFRSVPIHDIRIEGEEAGQQLSSETIRKRTVRIHQEWWRMVTVQKQQKVRRLAVKLQAYIWAKANLAVGFSIRDNFHSKIFEVYREGHDRPVMVLPYHLASSYVRWHRFSLLLRCIRGKLGDVRATLYAYIVSDRESTFWLFRYAQRCVNGAIVMLAFPTAFLWPHFGARPKKLWIEFCLWLNNYAYYIHYTIMEKRKGSEWVLANFQSFKTPYEKRYYQLLSYAKQTYPTIYQSSGASPSAKVAA